MIEREGALEAVGRHAAAREDRARIVDQHVDARLGSRDLGAEALDLGELRQVGIVNGVAEAGCGGLELRERRPPTGAIARHDDQPRPHAGEAQGRDLADPGGCAGHHHGLVAHTVLLLAAVPASTYGIAFRRQDALMTPS